MKKLAQLTTALLAATPLPALAQAPALLPVQGILTDSAGTPIDGPVDVTFRIYDADTGGNMLFEETHPGLQVEAGLFTAYLGAVAGLDLGIFSQERWLGVSVGADPEMPRFLLGTTPYAAFAQVCGDAATVGGLGAADISVVGHTHDFGTLTGIPGDIADGDQDTTYSAGPGVNIANNVISLDQMALEMGARNVCYDQEAELTAALDDNYAALNHTHPAPQMPMLDCQTVTLPLPIPPGNGSLDVDCPAGYGIVGGGVEVSGTSFANISVYRSTPDTNAQRYRCGVNNSGGVIANMACTARCCRIQ